MTENFQELYNPENAPEWNEEKTMEHASGIWGRDPMLQYLRDEVIKPGDKVLDIGSGAGYPSARMAEMVGKDGTVVGLEYSKSMLGIADDEKGEPASKKYEALKQLMFINGDATNMPIQEKSFDVATSFMVLHNLELPQVQKVLQETARVLKPGGKAVFLTMHPDMLESDWKLDFMEYPDDAIAAYKALEEKEGFRLSGKVKNAGGGEKQIGLVVHTRENMQQAIAQAGLELAHEEGYFIDADTAAEKFGENASRVMPTTPTFWKLELVKPESTEAS
ncbi:MAG: class I SAM-dependent methyltransferase [Patescibacteria group bacterium]